MIETVFDRMKLEGEVCQLSMEFSNKYGFRHIGTDSGAFPEGFTNENLLHVKEDIIELMKDGQEYRVKKMKDYIKKIDDDFNELLDSLHNADSGELNV